MSSDRFIWPEATTRKRNHLTHVDVPGGLYFVTWCLDDALTPDFQRHLRELRRKWVTETEVRFGCVRQSDRRMIDRNVRVEVFKEMDLGRGSCPLANSNVAEMITSSLNHFDGTRYVLFSYAVMPNHVHAVFQSDPEIPWWKVTGGWKSYTSKEANKILGRTGKLWQDDTFETLIKSPGHLERANRYVLANPEKAGLKDWPWVALLRVPRNE